MVKWNAEDYDERKPINAIEIFKKNGIYACKACIKWQIDYCRCIEQKKNNYISLEQHQIHILRCVQTQWQSYKVDDYDNEMTDSKH